MKNIKTFESFNYDTLNESVGILGAIFLAICGYKFLDGLIKDIKSRRKLSKEQKEKMIEFVYKALETAQKENPKSKYDIRKDIDIDIVEIEEEIESGNCETAKDLAKKIMNSVKNKNKKVS